MKAKELLLSLPEKFKSEGLEKDNAIFHFLIEGNDGGDYTVNIINGICTVNEGISGDADCKIKATEENLTKIINKELKAEMALFTGKLKISNLGVMMKYAKNFGLM